MPENFLQIQKEYLQQAWLHPPEGLEAVLPARRHRNSFQFSAFGEPCEINSQEIIFFGRGQKVIGPEGILIATYASHVGNGELQLHPLKSFRELSDSMPYQGAFAASAERILQPYVFAIQKRQ